MSSSNHTVTWLNIYHPIDAVTGVRDLEVHYNVHIILTIGSNLLRKLVTF